MSFDRVSDLDKTDECDNQTNLKLHDLFGLDQKPKRRKPNRIGLVFGFQF